MPPIASSITTSDYVKTPSVGTIIQANDPTFGTGEFIWLNGAASTVVGSPVIYDQLAGTTTLTVAGSRGPVAIAMSANVAGQQGWYQIAGAAVVKTAPVVAGANAYATATPGQLDDAVVAGDKIDGLRFKTADGNPSAGFVVAQLDRPAMNGNG